MAGAMRRSFSSGLVLGSIAGLAIGLGIGVGFVSPRGDRDSRATALQVEELTLKLAEAQEARRRADQQLERFAQLAEQMTASFDKLDERFKALAALAEALEAQATAVPSSPSAPATPTSLSDSPS